METFADRIKQRRAYKAALQEKEAEKKTQQAQSTSIVHAVSREGARSRTTSQKDIDELISQLKEVQLASLMGGQPKTTVVLTDSTDLGQSMNKMTEVLVRIEKDRTLANAMESLSKRVGELQKATAQGFAALGTKVDRQAADVKSLTSALSKKETVVVPAPEVSFSEREVDFSGVTTLLKQLVEQTKPTSPTNTMEGFVAHDLDDAPDGLQYIGFVHPDGRWYIMAHDTASNRDRYCMTKDTYERAWDERYSHKYKLLNKAAS